MWALGSVYEVGIWGLGSESEIWGWIWDLGFGGSLWDPFGVGIRIWVWVWARGRAQCLCPAQGGRGLVAELAPAELPGRQGEGGNRRDRAGPAGRPRFPQSGIGMYLLGILWLSERWVMLGSVM